MIKSLLVSLLFLFQIPFPGPGRASTAGGVWPNGYTYRRALTVQAAQITGTLTDFPVLVSGTYSYLATVANGGLVTNANGYDVVFTASDGTTALKHETEIYTDTSGLVSYWVKLPSVAVGTVFYIYYGNSSVTTNQSDPTNVWDSNFKGVWHLPNGSTLTALDSTSGASNGTLTNAPAAAAGKADGAGSFAVGSSQYISVGDVAPLDITGNLTISAWVYITSAPGGYMNIASKYSNPSSYSLDWHVTGIQEFRFYVHDMNTTVIFGSTTASLNTWYHVTGTYSTSGDLNIYVNGASDATTVTGADSSIANSSASFLIGARDTGPGDFMDGRIDEVRVSSATRSAAWVQAEYNTSVSPSMFYAVGSQETN